jgi:hypothetical protein
MKQKRRSALLADRASFPSSPSSNQVHRLVFIELPFAPTGLDLRSTENCWQVYVLMSR